MGACLDQLSIIAVGGAELIREASLPGDDFEDNLQLSCAMTLGLDAIVARDPSGFPEGLVRVWSPQEAVRSISG